MFWGDLFFKLLASINKKPPHNFYERKKGWNFLKKSFEFYMFLHYNTIQPHFSRCIFFFLVFFFSPFEKSNEKKNELSVVFFMANGDWMLLSIDIPLCICICRCVVSFSVCVCVCDSQDSSKWNYSVGFYLFS